VEDNGTGIAEADLPKIFDPFFTTKEVGKGLGLGLSISYNIIRDFGGSITAANRPEGGAQFVVTLCRTTAKSVEAAE
jgi:two-component system C4-dicarboxylate transport sensor histidine kinase DctB